MTDGLPDKVDKLSATALRVEVFGGGTEVLSTGTGFVVDTPVGPSLVTARHLLTGRHHYSGHFLHDSKADPKWLRVTHRMGEGSTLRPSAIGRREELYDSADRPKWYEDSRFADLCDYAILPLTAVESAHLIKVDPVFLRPEFTDATVPKNLGDKDTRIIVTPSEPLSVVGYPFGNYVGSVFPLWATGALAIDLAFEDAYGRLYIDCRTRPGQSGSPVFVKRQGTVALSGIGECVIDGWARAFVGVYSGRITDASDIGVVYSARRISQTIDELGSAFLAKPPTGRVIDHGWRG